MEPNRLDALSRTLSVSPLRRRALLALAVGALGLLGGAGLDQTSAHNALKACRRKKTPKARARCKKKARQHNAKHRVNQDRCAGVVCDTAPRATMGCKDGICVVTSCDEGFDNCDGDPETGCETNLRGDIRNCGRCGFACPTASGAMQCVAGKCVIDRQYGTPGGPYRFTVELDGTLEIEASGGRGGNGGSGQSSSAGNSGGPGGQGEAGTRVRTTIPVMAGDQFDVFVGGGGGNGSPGGPGGLGGFGGTAGQWGENPSSGVRGGGGGGGGGTSEVKRVAGNVRVAAASGGSGGGGGGGGGGVPVFGSRGGNGGRGGISTGDLGASGGDGGPGGPEGQSGRAGGQGRRGSGFPSGAVVSPSGNPNGFVILTFRAT